MGEVAPGLGGREESRTMKSCPGQLVVHRDGTVAYCTEKNGGHACAGEDRPHRGGFLSCRVVDDEACAHCCLMPATLTSS
jgi:hypothetical protein